jgi:hypothetical protein
MPVSPQLQQGLVNLIYFTWLHNSEALAYFVGCLIALYLQFKKPNRKNLFLFVGFLTLLVQFEYVKHMIEPLLDQALQAVLEQGAAATRFQKLLDFFLQKFIPLALYLFGWGSLFISLFLTPKTPGKKTIK